MLHEALDRGEDPERAARAALSVSDECVEAWLLLADFATSAAEARERVRRAVATATRVLGEAGLREGRGKIGETADGVAYLHALTALARQQVAEDRVEQAIQSFQGLLAMDPSDPVQVRGDLLLLLLSEARDDEAEDLLAAYTEEANAIWMFARALLRRRRALDEEALRRAGAALDRAIALFPSLARALLSDATSKSSATASDEAILRRSFEDTEGALDWLRERAGSTAPAPMTPGAPTSAPEVAAERDRRFSAREYVEEAWGSDPKRREVLARTALDLWPDCADAWRALASVAPSSGERVERLREAVAAGARSLGRVPGAPPAPVGDSEESRDYLRARRDLAESLRTAGDEDGARREERALLADDPDDVLGVGLALVGRLLAAGLDDEAREWLARHEEDAAPGWVWARVLARRRAGDAIGASFAFAEATVSAPLVGPLLLGRAEDFRDIAPESADAWHQATRAAEVLRAAWAATPGAIEWLEEKLPRPPARSRAAPRRAPRE